MQHDQPHLHHAAHAFLRSAATSDRQYQAIDEQLSTSLSRTYLPASAHEGLDPCGQDAEFDLTHIAVLGYN